jgi:hypothetical protein
LSHDKFNVLGLQAGIVDFLLIVIVFLLGLLVFDLLALSVLIVVVMTSMIFTGLLSCELLSGGSLVLRVEILDLGLTENAILMLVPASRIPLAVNKTHIQVLLVGDR